MEITMADETNSLVSLVLEKKLAEKGVVLQPGRYTALLGFQLSSHMGNRSKLLVLFRSKKDVMA